jgi:phage terminase large subunit-like protein
MSMSDAARLLADAAAAEEGRRKFRQLDYFKPYPKQRKFLDSGASFRERLLLAGNQSGKSVCAAFEMACHLTGLYPPWWQGKRFDRPVTTWCCGESAMMTMTVCQQKLCGTAGVESAWGTGLIPKDCLLDRTLGHGVTDGIEILQVRHVSGGVSTTTFKSYEQGRTKFQGATLDVLWFDEEPPMDIYLEGLTRTMVTGGVVLTTYTGIKGGTDVTDRFLKEEAPDRIMINMTLDEAEHFTPAQREALIKSWPEYMRECRSTGYPMMGEGRVFTTPEANIVEPRLRDRDIPHWWRKIWGIDIGIRHPFAAVLLLWEKDIDGAGADVIHIHRTIRMSDQTPIMHAAAMKQIGGGVPVAWPKDAGDRDRGTGVPIRALYKAQGLRMLDAPATHPTGFADHNMSTSAGIVEWDQLERLGQLKVASDLHDWLEERRNYHTENGQIVKLRDDLMSATRIGLMMRRYAKAVPLGPYVIDAPSTDPANHFARGTPRNQPFDLFTGAPLDRAGGFDLFTGRRRGE